MISAASVAAGANWTKGRTDRETVITDLLDGQYSNSVRIVAFNAAQGWSRGMCRKTLQTKSHGAAPWTASMCRRTSKAS
jgi:hypothetical protein